MSKSKWIGTSAAAGLAALGAVILLPPVSASAATYATPVSGQTFKGGAHHPGTVYADEWKFQGKRGFWCMSFSGHASDGTTNRKITGRVPGFTAANSTAVKKLVNSFTRSNSGKVNAERAMAVWYLSSDKKFHADWWPTYVPQLKRRGEYSAVMSLVSWAKTHGTYKVSVSASHVLVGQSGSGRVIVHGANGKAASKLKVKLTATGAKITKAAGKTNGNGVVSFGFRRTGAGKVSFKAAVTAPSSSAVMLTNASPGRQKLLSGHFKATAHGAYHFNKSPGKPAMTTSCTTQCNGVAKVTWTKKVEHGSSAMRYEYYTGSTLVAKCDAAGGKTCKASAKLADGTVWSSYKYCYLTKVAGTCKTSWVTVKVHKEIVCPAWVTWSVTCDCDSAPVLSATAPVASTRYYTETYEFGSTTETVDLTNGVADAIPLTGYKSGEAVSASFTVYRDAAHTKKLVSHAEFSGLVIG